MNRPFEPTDNMQRFYHRDGYGRLEFPLTDPGSATPDDAVIWYEDGLTWNYVKPSDVEEAS